MTGFFDPAALPPGALLWSLLFGLGVYLLVTSQPLGRPRPDMRERLHRLELDERIRIEAGGPEAHPLFASRLLEGMLRPVLDDAGRLVGGLFARLGLGGGAELERRLRLVRPGVEPVEFFGE